nr:beta-mannosidase [Williamsia soli]
MRTFPARHVATTLLAVLVVLVASLAGTSAAGAEPGPARVQATPTGLTLDGQDWWPSGFNAYQLATDWSVNAGCGAMVDLDEYFGSLEPRSLTRFNAFQRLAVNKYTGQLDFGPMDAVFAAAARHDQLLVPVLTAGDGACEDEAFKDRQWYQSGWETAVPAGSPVRFDQWVQTAVNRWKSSSALAGWELVGEPEPGLCSAAGCSWQTRSCPADSGAVLRTFFDEAGALIRGIDPSTPIWAGLIGGGQCGSAGDDYRLVNASPAVDVLEYHDYGADAVPLPGDIWNGLQTHIVQAELLGKPLVVAEIGQNAGSCGSVVGRAADFETKVDGQRQAGTAGALFWAFVPDPRPGECTFDIGPDDPVFDLVEDLNTVSS